MGSFGICQLTTRRYMLFSAMSQKGVSGFYATMNETRNCVLDLMNYFVVQFIRSFPVQLTPLGLMAPVIP